MDQSPSVSPRKTGTPYGSPRLRASPLRPQALDRPEANRDQDMAEMISRRKAALEAVHARLSPPKAAGIFDAARNKNPPVVHDSDEALHEAQSDSHAEASEGSQFTAAQRLTGWATAIIAAISAALAFMFVFIPSLVFDKLSQWFAHLRCSSLVLRGTAVLVLAVCVYSVISCGPLPAAVPLQAAGSRWAVLDWLDREVLAGRRSSQQLPLAFSSFSVAQPSSSTHGREGGLAAASEELLDLTTHWLRRMLSKEVPDKRQLILDVNDAAPVSSECNVTVRVDRVARAVVIHVQSNAALQQHEVVADQLYGLRTSGPMLLEAEAVMSRVAPLLSTVMLNRFPRYRLVVLGAGQAGSVATLLTLMLMKRQTDEQLSVFAAGFLHGIVVQCDTFGSWPMLRPTANKPDLPIKSVAAISNWIIRGDTGPLTTLEAAESVGCWSEHTRTLELTAETRVDNAAWNQCFKATAAPTEHAGRLLLLSNPLPGASELEVLRVAPEELGVMAMREKWHLKPQMSTVADYYKALSSVTRSASFGGPATRGQF